MQITINDKTLELKYSFRALLIYEQITGKSFEPQNFTDLITFFYSIVLAADRDMTLTYDAFIDYLDGNQEKVTEFSEWLTEYARQQADLHFRGEEKKTEKKTKARKSKK